ncbi:TcaA NTF2-like domain-containing protein [Staphylococcus saprophyticus]|jgi:uncharacterized membrane protein YvbJ|uniref:TcaA NTF2-like domain-containing protein n=1 Tax=Staphylococcus saprophyticus TaxID=29385 RepID=UPI001642A508|nr:hypothetical protein [Staphylococcus saprophyticus]MBC2921937.1 hypothetical protein [Staphylococcus saprophyticus]MBC2958540.1 hypothetical protein [Staphylococcus saprophyticus]MBC3010377.1 hypothetical protein [Staphylococcus saprophyticus]MBC3024256.1 hypothetical protein [Staphylococcus saprophyticus]MBC3031483.1 hypothetical protein [Staphylococcus saprophyticus]
MTNNEDNNTKTIKKKYIIISSILSVLLIVGLLIYFILSQTNAQGQIEDFKNAAHDKDYKKLTAYLSSGERDLSNTEAEAFAKYINEPENKKRFDKEIKVIEDNIKDNDNYDLKLGSITDNNNRNIIDVKKNGKKFLFIDKVIFKPKYTNIYVKENDNTGIYDYKNDKKRHVASDRNSLSSIGEFFTGKYSIDTKKKIEDTELTGASNGKLEFNTEVTNKNNNVVAMQDFNQSSFKINLKNSDDLDDRTIKIMINDKEQDYEKNKIYGNYYNANELNVYAIGEIDGENIESNAIKIKKNKYQSPQELNVTFNQNKINKIKLDNKKIEAKAKDFMNDYIKALNKAYKKSDYKYISEYIKEDTNVSRHMKKMVNSNAKNKYSNLEFQSVKKNNENVQVILTKEVSKEKVTSKYLLEVTDSKFKITNYKDI